VRFVIKKYDNGGWSAVETTNDGSAVIAEIGGSREVGQRISAYLEATFDDNEKGASHLLEVIPFLKAQVEGRTQSPAGKDKQGRVGPRKRP